MNDLLHHIFLFLHFVGLASLVGGLLVQWKAADREINPAILYGALAQIVTGLLLYLTELDEANHIKVTVKLIVLVVILVIALLRRRKSLGDIPYWTMLGLSVANVGIAVFW